MLPSAAATTAATGRFPRSATILGFILFVRLIRFPEGPMSRSDQPATGEMIDLPTGATHYEWLESTTLLSEVPVVVVHGFSGDLEDVRPLASKIRDAGHRVLVYDTQLTFVRSFGSEGNGRGELCKPTGIAVHRSGDLGEEVELLVADSGNGRSAITWAICRYIGLSKTMFIER